MRIWHVGDFWSPERVDGVSNAAWLLAAEQAHLGHDISLIISSAPDNAALGIAAGAGIALVRTSKSILRFSNEVRRILQRRLPDVVHMHSVFIPQQAVMARVLRQRGIPYVIKPAGGLLPQVLRRNVIKKGLYSLLIERPRFMGAAAIANVTPGEEDAIRAYLPSFRKPVRWISNPVNVQELGPHRWQGVPSNAAQKRISFLGRFDVLCKGIDVLVEIARMLPEAQFDLYGTEDAKTRDWLARLQQKQPANVAFHEPIFGAAKGKMLAGATLYLQPSRWEGFGISVAEAMYLGVPCAISGTMNMAGIFRPRELGLVLSADPRDAADQIREALSRPEQLQQWSQRGRDFARTHFHPRVVVEKYLALYQEAIDARSAGQGKSNSAGRTRRTGSKAHARQRSGRAALVPADIRASIKRKIARMMERFAGRTRGSPRTVVLCYHSIAEIDVGLAVDPPMLREHIGILRELGFSFRNFSDLVDELRAYGTPSENVACLTFDDGYEDNLTQAAPLLLDLKVPATVFVTSGLMLGDRAVCEHFRSRARYETNFMSPRQVAELHRAGFEIGAHTHTHPNMATLSVERTREEVARSKTALEDAIGAPVHTFAYPFGKRSIHYTPMTVRAVREAGFSAAAAVAFRAVPPARSVRLFEVPRFFVSRGDTPDTFRQKVCGHFDWLGTIQERAPRWLKAMVSPEDRY